MNSSLNKDNKNKDWTLLQIVQWYESNSLDCTVELIGSNSKKKELLKLSFLAASSACVLSLGLGACGPSKQDVALAEANVAMVQACEDSETAIKIAGKGCENGLNDVLALKLSCSRTSKEITKLTGGGNTQIFITTCRSKAGFCRELW